MRVLMITQKLDAGDPILAFTLDWVRELAARVQQLEVLCLEQRVKTSDLPANVHVWSMGKERGVGRVRELLTFYATLLRLAPSLDAIFAHMVPRYAWLAALVAVLFDVPIFLWYTHRQESRELHWATRVSKLVFTAAPDSFPLQTPKLRAVGHGIDTSFFAPDPQVPDDQPPLIVQVARLMPIKHQRTLLLALAVAIKGGIDVRVAIVGNVPARQDAEYLTQLQQLASELGIADRVQFTGGLPAPDVRDLYRRATIAINLSPPGLFDKAALESMITGALTIVCNPAFDALLRDHASLLRIASPEDVDGLVLAIRSVLELDQATRDNIALDIQGRARTAHSLTGLMDRLVEVMSAS
ncbi:MAG: glycosyltransferase family 4 protein [Anaerolineae bacterium]